MLLFQDNNTYGGTFLYHLDEGPLIVVGIVVSIFFFVVRTLSKSIRHSMFMCNYCHYLKIKFNIHESVIIFTVHTAAVVS